jgi:hypothetical protein
MLLFSQAALLKKPSFEKQRAVILELLQSPYFFMSTSLRYVLAFGREEDFFSMLSQGLRRWARLFRRFAAGFLTVQAFMF